MNALLQTLGLNQIRELPLDRLECIADYQQKWEEIATSCKPMDQLRLEQAISVFYHANGLAIPEIKVFSGPQSLQVVDNTQPPALSIAEQCKKLKAVQAQAESQDLWAGIAIVQLYLIPVFAAPYLWLIALYPHRLMEIIFTNVIAAWIFQSVKQRWFEPGNQILNLLSSRLLEPLWVLYISVVAPALLSAYLWPSYPIQAIVVGICYSLLLVRLLVADRQVQTSPMPWAPSTNLLDRQLRLGLSQSVMSKIEQAITDSWQSRKDHPLSENTFHHLARSYEMVFNHSEGILLAKHLYWFIRLDFCISELHCQPNLQLWDSMKIIMEECGWILPLEKVCWVCERPKEIYRDRQGEIHCLGGPAIAFADHSSLYAHHGIELPEQYGKLPTEQWQSRWILTEPNAEVRRLLIEAIGYGRLCEEQDATVLDTWREYELLRFVDHLRQPGNDKARFEEEPINLLKMTCPSTQHVHVIRVPPYCYKARDAARWINWDTDPEQFAVET